MACCCKGGKPSKASTSCLGRCDLPKHRCLDKDEVKPGPIPKYMGWLYNSKDSPDFQLRCGWRPGHISCPVLRRIEQHNSCTKGECSTCCSHICPKPSCTKPCCVPSKPECGPPCAGPPCCVKPPCCPGQALIRIIRHGGNYTICTKPSNVSNAPSGPYPLKYVLNCDDDAPPDPKAKYCVEAKFNDYHFDYTSSQGSFILDFTPPDGKCPKPCPKRSIPCIDPCPKC